MKYLLLNLILILSSITAYSADMPNRKISLTLKQAIDLGLENSHTLKAADWATKAQNAEKDVRFTDLLPSLKFNGGYSRLKKIPNSTIDIGGAIGVVEISKNYPNYTQLRASIQQPVFSGFRIISAYRYAKHLAAAQGEEANATRSNLIFNIENAYWSLFQAREINKVIQENIELTESHLRDVSNFYDQGLTTHDEVLRVKTQLSQNELLKIESDNDILLSQAQLNDFIGLDLETNIEIVSPLKTNTETLPPLEDMYGKAIQTRPELKGMRENVKANQQNVKIAKSGYYPTISLEAGSDYDKPNNRYFPSQDKFKNSWDVTVNVDFAIWEWMRTPHESRKARSQLIGAKEDLQANIAQVKLEVKKQYLDISQQERSIGVATQAVQQAQETYELTNNRYIEGIALSSDVLSVEVALLQAKIDLTQARIGYVIAQAALERAVGAL